MNIKQIDKTVIEISKQSVVDEIVKSFIEFAYEEKNNLDIILPRASALYHSLKTVDEGDYVNLFKTEGSLRCMPEQVYDVVENYFFDQDDDFEESDLEDEKSNIIGFKNFKEKELEIVIKDKDVVVGRIPQEEIPY